MKKLLKMLICFTGILFSHLLLAAPAPLVAALEQAAARQQLDSKVLLAIAQQTNFDPHWVGDDNRHGLMQLPLQITRLENSLQPAQVFDVQASASFAAVYLSRLLNLYDGDLKSALQHYYQGKAAESAVSLSWFGSSNRWAIKVYNSVMQASEGAEQRRFCFHQRYLDDFADPNSRLNQQRNATAKCQTSNDCAQHVAPCRYYY